MNIKTEIWRSAAGWNWRVQDDDATGPGLHGKQGTEDSEQAAKQAAQKAKQNFNNQSFQNGRARAEREIAGRIKNVGDPKEAGKKARQAGESKSANPYTGQQRANWERDQWNEGWDQG